ncbi:hypothetical protein MKX03_013786 [Papaver bracteatum]|nr:hypothetical protein MKX03_013786 [Papaver bracteatum]
MSSNARIRRVNSWGSPGVSPEGKLQLVNSSEKLTAEQQKILQSIRTQQQHQKQKEADELVEKHAYKESLFRNHPDILRFIRKKVPDPKSPNKHKEIIIRYHGSYDEDIDSDDEELYLVPDKSKWFDMCLAEWGMEPDDNLVSKVKAEETYFKIFTAGYCSEGGDSGCGAIIRDHWHRPIVASSKVISEGECASPFCLELEGVSLGIKLAKKYGVVFLSISTALLKRLLY